MQRGDNNFDLIRLAAAGQVALTHTLTHAGLMSRLPYALVVLLGLIPGVTVFFIMSGALVAASCDRNSLGRYAWHRALRIYPALWVCFGVTLALVTANGRHASPQWVLAQLTVGQFYTPDNLRGFGVGTPNGSLWTISVEVGFYVLLPFLAGVRAVVAFVVSLAAWVALAHLSGMPQKLLGVSPLPHGWMFLLGVFVYRAWDRVRPLVEGQVCSWLAVFVACTLVQPLLGAAGIVLADTALAALIFAAAYTAPTLSRRLLQGQDVSYGVYIYHMLVVNTLVVLGWTGRGLILPIAFVATAACGVVSWKVVERRALSHKGATLFRRSGRRHCATDFAKISPKPTGRHRGSGTLPRGVRIEESAAEPRREPSRCA